MKNLTELMGDWAQLKAKMKQQYASLTDDDLMLVEGKNEELKGRLQSRLGKSKEEVHKIISDL